MHSRGECRSRVVVGTFAAAGIAAVAGFVYLVGSRARGLPFFFFAAASPTGVYTLSVHEALPLSEVFCLWRGEGTIDVHVRTYLERARCLPALHGAVESLLFPRRGRATDVP